MTAHPATAGGNPFRRMGALVLRNLYLVRSSWPRVIEMAYWPTVQMIIWGFITKFFLTHSSWLVEAAGALIAAVLLWDTMFRGNLGVAVSFLEEMWSRNLAQIFVAPLRPWELVGALTGISLIRTLIGVVPAAVLAIPLYDYSIFAMGLPLLAFFTNILVMGWSVGLVVAGIVLRFGLGAEGLAWLAIFAFAPLSGVYYPIATLPPWLQPVAWALPSSYVFEGMRAVLFDGVFRWDLFAWSVGLNALYLGLAAAFFLGMFRVARHRGLLLDVGE